MTGATMLLDTASLYFRAFYGVPSSVRSPAGEPRNAARGLLDMIAKLVTTYRPGGIIACWDDDWRPAWRVDLVPSYKAHRALADGSEETPEDLMAQLPVIRASLAALGLPIVGTAAAEADDVIGTLSATVDGPVDIVTGDRDLFQLVDDERAVRVISTARGMSHLEVVTDAVVLEKYGVTAARYADFATLRGDPSDGLPGVRGIGDKTAAALLQKFGSIERLREAARPGDELTATQSKRIVEASDYLDVAPRVVAVRRDLTLGAVSPLTLPMTAAVDEGWGDANGLGSSWTRVLESLTPNAPSAPQA